MHDAIFHAKSENACLGTHRQMNIRLLYFTLCAKKNGQHSATLKFSRNVWAKNRRHSLSLKQTNTHTNIEEWEQNRMKYEFSSIQTDTSCKQTFCSCIQWIKIWKSSVRSIWCMCKPSKLVAKPFVFVCIFYVWQWKSVFGSEKVWESVLWRKFVVLHVYDKQLKYFKLTKICIKNVSF